MGEESISGRKGFEEGKDLWEERIWRGKGFGGPGGRKDLGDPEGEKIWGTRRGEKIWGRKGFGRGKDLGVEGFNWMKTFGGGKDLGREIFLEGDFPRVKFSQSEIFPK